MESNIGLICVAYLCFLNASIGLYVGCFGLDGFSRPRPMGLLIMICGTVGAFLLLYAQEKYGFKAQLKDIGISFAFFLVALIVGFRFRSNEPQKNLSSRGQEAMVRNRTVTGKAKQAGTFWRQGRYSEARLLYHDVLSVTTNALDGAKILANIAQVYEKEGSQAKAIDSAREALKIISENNLYKSSEGSHLRGYLNGFLNRLKGKDLWEPPEYDGSISLDMNLSMPGRLRTHFAVAVIGAGISSTIVSQIPIPQLDNLWPNGRIILSWILGFILGAAVTSKMLEQVVASLCIISKKPIHACLKPAVNLLAVIAIIYLALMPYLFKDLVKEFVWFTITGFLGVAFFYVLVIGKHAKRID